MSAANPYRWDEVLDPPTALFKASHLYPLLTYIDFLYLSLKGSNIYSTNCCKLFTISELGVLSIPSYVAVELLHNSLIVKYFIVSY